MNNTLEKLFKTCIEHTNLKATVEEKRIELEEAEKELSQFEEDYKNQNASQ